MKDYYPLIASSIIYSELILFVFITMDFNLKIQTAALLITNRSINITTWVMSDNYLVICSATYLLLSNQDFPWHVRHQHSLMSVPSKFENRDWNIKTNVISNWYHK